MRVAEEKEETIPEILPVQLFQEMEALQADPLQELGIPQGQPSRAGLVQELRIPPGHGSHLGTWSAREMTRGLIIL